MDSTPLNPITVARLLGVSVHSIRRWCAWHSPYLSPDANPPTGSPRRLTLRDVEVLRAVRDMRSEGLQTDPINARLAALTFAVIDSPDIAIIGPSAAPSGPQHEQTALAHSTDDSLIVRLQFIYDEVAEMKARQMSGITAFGLGFLACGVLFLAIMLLLVLLGR